MHLRLLILGTTLSVFAAPLAAQRVEKAIPIEKDTRSDIPLVAFRQGAVSMTVNPTESISKETPGRITHLLQQRASLAVVQALSTWLYFSYDAGLALRSQEVQAGQQPDQSSATLALLNRPALTWKPRPGVETEVAWETRQNLHHQKDPDTAEAAVIQGKVQIAPPTVVGASYRHETADPNRTTQVRRQAGRLTTETSLPGIPVRLQINPGVESTRTNDAEPVIRNFVESAIIWTVDDATRLTFGTGFAGGRNVSSSESGYIELQHIIRPRTALEMRASAFNSGVNDAGEGLALSAGSRISLAEALSAGLSVRYKMDENRVADRPRSETFLSVSVNGSF